MSKKLAYPAGLIVAVLIAFFVYQRYHVAPLLKLNELSLADLDGQAVNLKDYSGKKMIVCFGASWCGNCYEELDMIASVKTASLNDVEVIVVSDESMEK